MAPFFYKEGVKAPRNTKVSLAKAHHHKWLVLALARDRVSYTMKLERIKIIFLIQIFIIFIFILSITVGISLKKTFKETRNLVRARHLEIISNAVYTYYIIYSKLPECVPNSGEAIEINKCQEIELFLTSFPKDPSPGEKYLIKYFNEKKEAVVIFSSATEAKDLKIIH